MISRRLHAHEGLIVHEVSGPLLESEFLAAARMLYALEAVPRLSLWDLSRCTGGLKMDDLRRLQDATVPLVRGRENGKTAIVAPSDLLFGITRQYAALAEAREVPMSHAVFRSTKEALDWLGLDGDALGEANELPPVDEG